MRFIHVSVVTLLVIFIHADSRCVGAEIFWSQVGTPPAVGYVGLNGSGQHSQTLATKAFGMETVASTSEAYWIQNDPGNTTYRIMVSGLDLVHPATLVGPLPHGDANQIDSSLNLAADPIANLIFWTGTRASPNGTINFARLSDGQNIGSFVSPGSYADDIALDSANQKVYWTVQSGGGVFRANYDGSGMESLIPDNHAGGFTGIALDLPAGKIYLASPDIGIIRADLTGANQQTIYGHALGERLFGMDLFGGRMYWADLSAGRIRSANLDGSDPTTVLSGLSMPRQVSVLVPEPSGIVTAIAGAFCLIIIGRARFNLMVTSPAGRSSTSR